MIRQRKEAVERYYEAQEQLKYIEYLYQEMRDRLKKMYAMRSGAMAQSRFAREKELQSSGKTLRSFVNHLSGRYEERVVKARIENNFAMTRERGLAEEILSMEDALRVLVEERKEQRERLKESKEAYKTARQELEDYIQTRDIDAPYTLEEYEEQQRKVRLFTKTCQKGNAYYTAVKEVDQRIQGSRLLARKPLGKKPGFEVHLQNAYTEQAKKWTVNAERLQMEFVAQARLLEHYTGETFEEAGKIAYSSYLFGTTTQKLLTRRRGEELYRLLQDVKDQLATQLLEWETEKQQIVTKRNTIAEAIGLQL